MSMRMKLMGAVTMSLSLGFAAGFALGFAGAAWAGDGTAHVPASGAEAKNFGCGAKGQRACPSIHVER
ncbi:hypothetical protein [Sorangium sp. So ce406]|uniref:hypothetical protein n=1 Tax=Sorangium sp. So ce406 TaxID=3133311 RepID=UPI003F5B1558